MKDTVPRKFVREYYNDNKKIAARWHYDHSVTKNGPVLVEEYNLPPKEKKSRKQKKVAE